jgi:hypothetical protein
MKKSLLTAILILTMTGCASVKKGLNWGKSEMERERDEWFAAHNLGTPSNNVPATATENVPFTAAQVKNCGGDAIIVDWPVALNIVSVTIAGNVSFQYDAESLARATSYPRIKGISNDPNACIGAIVEWEPDLFCQFIGEWLLPGMQFQQKKMFDSERGKHHFSGPLRDATFDDFKGKRIWIFVCTPNWVGKSNGIHERSNLFGPMVIE